MEVLFLHGLDTSGNGTKGTFFKNRFPEMIVADFHGNLDERLAQLEKICETSRVKLEPLLLIGSSFGGLMATCFAIRHPDRVAKLILLAPALNFPGLIEPKQPVTSPTYLLIGSRDEVTPPDVVIPQAKKLFTNLEINLVDEDHLLHQSFPKLDWAKLLSS